jgi:hypothetical protein
MRRGRTVAFVENNESLYVFFMQNASGAYRILAHISTEEALCSAHTCVHRPEFSKGRQRAMLIQLKTFDGIAHLRRPLQW